MLNSFQLFIFLCLSVPAMAGEFSGDRAYALLEELCAIGPRVPSTQEARQAGDWLLAELQAQGWTVEQQRFNAKVSPEHPWALRDSSLLSEGLPLRNLIARQPGASGERFVLAAHWDSRPFADKEKDPDKREQPVLGANDAASGVVVLLELARCLAKTPQALDIELVFFDGEDWGREGNLDAYFLGSREYARLLQQPLPIGGILLDMIGDKDLNIPLEPFSWQANPELCRRVWELGQDLGYGHIFQWRMGPAVQDDHLSLIRFGIPMIDLIDFDFPQWHTLGDTPDTCSPASLEAVGRVLEVLLAEGL